MADFKKLLSVDAGSVEKPKPIPVGTYDAVITKHEFGESKEQKTPYCRVTLRLVSPGPDVDLDAFGAFGGQPSLAKKELNQDYWLTEDALHRFRAFFEDGLGMSVVGKTFDELAPQMNNQSVKVEIVHTVSKKDNQTVYANINRILHA